MGIEPTQPAWKAGILPLNYTRIYGDPYENRTRVTAVKGPCLNLLTNGPKYERRLAADLHKKVYGGGNWIRTSDTAGMNRVL